MLVYTDGVIEARDRGDEEFGLPRLTELCTGGRSFVGRLLPRTLEAVQTWSADLGPEDDITLVAVDRDR